MSKVNAIPIFSKNIQIYEVVYLKVHPLERIRDANMIHNINLQLTKYLFIKLKEDNLSMNASSIVTNPLK